MKTLVKTGLVALLSGTTGYAAFAGTVSGTITGPDGAPFRAAFVRVQNLATIRAAIGPTISAPAPTW
jgi:hypothetical protein